MERRKFQLFKYKAISDLGRTHLNSVAKQLTRFEHQLSRSGLSFSRYNWVIYIARHVS